MFVVVAFVGGVSVSVVDVVQMVAVEDRGVAASLTVHVDVLLNRLMPRLDRHQTLCSAPRHPRVVPRQPDGITQ